MKTFISFLLAFVFAVTNAAGNKYFDAMTKAIEKQKSASTIEAFLESANTFERIGQMEKTEWLPLYYAAHCYIVISFMVPENDKKDAVLDKAQHFLDNAFKLAPEESELFALQAFLYPARITVDPMGRGMEYIGKMNHALDEAIQLNPDNPRCYYLRAITILNMPEGFGGGSAAARPIFEIAKQKFDKFEPESSIYPNWGKEYNEKEMSKL